MSFPFCLTFQTFNLRDIFNVFSHYDQQIAKRMDPSWDWRRENMQLVLPFYHNFGFTTTMICLMAGSTGIIIRRYEPRIFLRTIQDYKVCCFYGIQRVSKDSSVYIFIK